MRVTQLCQHATLYSESGALKIKNGATQDGAKTDRGKRCRPKLTDVMNSDGQDEGVSRPVSAAAVSRSITASRVL